ncbi:hypothetical protein ACLHDD_07930 [Pantoea sp. NSTU24]|uniref:hypothetical protein n=1 Tax=Pantoea sp. NSTU24 TaxID=3391144 RepID=UPI003D008F78
MLNAESLHRHKRHNSRLPAVIVSETTLFLPDGFRFPHCQKCDLPYVMTQCASIIANIFLLPGSPSLSNIRSAENGYDCMDSGFKNQQIDAVTDLRVT